MAKPPLLLATLAAVLSLLRLTNSYTLSFPNGTTCTDYYTLTPAVTYTMNITFSPTPIAAGSYLTIQFGYRYNITATSLSNCQFTTSGASYATTNCTVSSSGASTATVYVLTFPNVYPGDLVSQTAINLIVRQPLLSSRSPTPGAEAPMPPKTSLPSSTTLAPTPSAADRPPFSSGRQS